MDDAKISAEQLTQFARDAVPFMQQMGVVVTEVEPGAVTMKVPLGEEFVRPGDTISGPVMMALADFVMRAVVMSLVGPADLAVTTNLNVNFLHRPTPGDLIARGSILTLSQRLAVGEVSLYCEDEEDLVAHVTCTYALPSGLFLPTEAEHDGDSNHEPADDGDLA
jgi:uncharacterized protein (TIGR00369 family)